MRSTLMSMLFAAGIGLVGVTGTSAAPTSGTAPAGTPSLLQQIQYGGYGGGYYRRYCWREYVCDYYGYCHYVRRCNY